VFLILGSQLLGATAVGGGGGEGRHQSSANGPSRARRQGGMKMDIMHVSITILSSLFCLEFWIYFSLFFRHVTSVCDLSMHALKILLSFLPYSLFFFLTFVGFGVIDVYLLCKVMVPRYYF
jgi:hypothetical protein